MNFREYVEKYNLTMDAVYLETTINENKIHGETYRTAFDYFDCKISNQTFRYGMGSGHRKEIHIGENTHNMYYELFNEIYDFHDNDVVNNTIMINKIKGFSNHNTFFKVREIIITEKQKNNPVWLHWTNKRVGKGTENKERMTTVYSLQPDEMYLQLLVYPKIEDVLCCLAMDANCVIGKNFNEFCLEMGYDNDSCKAEKIYNDCLFELNQLIAIMPNIQELLNCEE